MCVSVCVCVCECVCVCVCVCVFVVVIVYNVFECEDTSKFKDRFILIGELDRDEGGVVSKLCPQLSQNSACCIDVSRDVCVQG